MDLSFISLPLRHLATWNVHPTLTSDHFAVSLQLQTPQFPPMPPPPPKWNQDLANWVTFQRELEAWGAHYSPPDDIDLLETDLQEAIHRAANSSMPLRRPGKYTYKESWYYCPEVRELKARLNRVRKIFRRRRTPENLELLQTVSADVNNKLTVIRNEKWLEWCAKISQYTSLADIWRWLKRVGGKYSASQPIHPNPE